MIRAKGIVLALALAGLALPTNVNRDPAGAEFGTVTRSIFPLRQLSASGQQAVEEATPIITLEFNYALNPYFVTTSVNTTGTATQANSMAVLQTGVGAAGSSQFRSTYSMRYLGGTGAFASFTALFSPCVANSQQEIGLADDNDGYLFGCQNAVFGLFRRAGASDTFVAQAAWNYDKFDGTGPSGVTLDITKGNVYKVQYLWHGYGAIVYYVFDGLRWAPCHIINYSNANTTPHVLNPTLPLRAKVVNTGNTTNLTLKTASMGAYIEGKSGEGSPPVIGALGSKGNTKATSTTEGAIITYRVKATNVLGGTNTNKIRVKFPTLSIASSSGAQDIKFRLVLNTTLGGSPSFADFDTNTSVIQTDTAGTTLSGGRELYTQYVPNGTNLAPPVEALGITLNPGDQITIAATSLSGTPNAFGGMSFTELP